jgi:outer membrane biosynthesis protein TonB
VQPVTRNNAADESSAPIYSAQDVDVRPPQMLEANLPRPAVMNWPTVKNSMELVVTEDGTVQHVKWLTSRERMPDVMLLSRAKLWKFSPALRDGRPVRYRLVVTWEVNP